MTTARPDAPVSPAPSPPTPATPPDVRDLPHPITFFVTGRDRRQILRALRRIDGNRVFALRRALGLDDPGLAPD
ncbi:MAG: hypothetical protein HND58_18260 [Planctomycetota bacterium]|nr:MAG: hypothetical protein HND58_18260 [Planctomycetota bacterium]